MDDYDHVMNITARMGKEMLQAGANLERVNFVMTKLLHAYEIHNISLHTLSTNLIISGVSPDGENHIKQMRVAPADVNLSRLRELNSLSDRIIEEKPVPTSVYSQIESVIGGKAFPWYFSLIGFVIAMACLCRIFGGTWQEILIGEFNTVMLFFVTMGLGKLRIDKILINFIGMFLASSSSLLFTYVGFTANCYTVVITNAFFLINGIGMVNAVRNLLCGNEMNGIIELLKVFLEIVSLVAGIAAAFFLFGGWYGVEVEDAIVIAKNDFLSNFELVGLSFLASAGFSIVFKMDKWQDVLLAGISGMLVRIVYLLLLSAIPEYRVLYASLAALSAALYAEILAAIRHGQSTHFIYPAIVPLIPGDLFYYAAMGIVWKKGDMFATNASACLVQLVGISVGFVVFSSIVYLVKRIQLNKKLLVFNHANKLKKQETEEVKKEKEK